MLRRLGVEIKGEVGTLERFLGVALANTEAPELVSSKIDIDISQHPPGPITVATTHPPTMVGTPPSSIPHRAFQ